VKQMVVAPDKTAPQLPLADLFQRLDSSTQGLTTQEAQHRLQQNGPNEPAAKNGETGFAQLLRLFGNPLVLILLIASGVSALTGDRIDASIIAVIVLLSVTLDFVQTYRSQQAAARLRASVTPTATVLRDGAWKEIPRRELVTGDVIRLSAGAMVPADARLLEARDLHVQQAALTGESMPVEKEVTPPGGLQPAGTDAPDRVFLGTSVVSGTATAVVTATGKTTAFGDIAARLATRPPETDFERGTRQFGLLIMRTVFFLVLFILTINLAFKHTSPLQSLLFAVSLAVGLTPEGLPMITTVTLGQGALRMARKKVIVKHLATMQNFGSMDVLCSDKTGTLTTGDLVLDKCLDPLGQPSDRTLLLAYLNSANETGIRNPLEDAVLKQPKPDVTAYRKLDEIPFDFERRRLSVVMAKDSERLLITQGAPESILPLCTGLETSGQSAPLDAESLRRCQATFQHLSAAGYRVLAVAYRKPPVKDAYHVADEQALTLAGFLAFIDPPLPGVAGVVQSLKSDGVSLKILTGDNELVTRHICEQVGLYAGKIVLGDEIDHMSDPALAQVAEQTTVFARVSPAQKNRILLALKRRKHVVGFLGDGINDAPSLHAADVGISVASAVDVAKESAEIILLERSLDVLHQGILEGRKAFANVTKYLLMGTSSNFGNMFSMAGAVLFLPFLPMLPTQILLNNLLYDLSQVTIPTDNVDEAAIRQPLHWDIGLIRSFMVKIGPLSSIYDFLTFYAMLKVFHAGQALFHTGWFVESLATQTLVIFIIRTPGNAWKSRPSAALTFSVLLVVLIGMALPFIPSIARSLGFTPLPAAFFLFLAGVVGTYLLLVELAKRRLMNPSASSSA